MYEDQTFEAILQRMLDRVDDNVDKRPGSVIFDALAPAAAELAQIYIDLRADLNLRFADTATDEFLDKAIAWSGIKRKVATTAKLRGVFYDNSGGFVNIPIGSRYSLDDLNYTAISKLSDGNYTLECETTGSVGNRYFGNLLPIEYIDGLARGEITEVLIPGEDKESDTSLYDRYQEKVSRPVTSGNRYQYELWARETIGVGRAKAFPEWNGPGTVKVVLLNNEMRAPLPSVVQTVQNYIDPTQDGMGEGVAPIGPIVTVVGAVEVPININVDVDWAPGYSSVFTPRVISRIEAEDLTINSGYGGSIDDTQAGASGSKCVKFTYVTNGNSKATISGDTLTNMLGKAGQYKIRARIKVSDTTSTTKFFVLSVQNPQTSTPFERYQGSGVPSDDQIMFSPSQLSTDWTWVELPFYWDGVQPIELWTGRPHSLLDGVTLWEDQVEFISDDGISKAPADVQKQIEDGVKSYLESLAFVDPLVRITRIANVLLDIPPILDYRDLTINGTGGNIAIPDGAVAVLGMVTIT